MLQVIKVSATWCGPCKVLAPEFNKVKESRSDVEFIEADVDKDQDIAEKYGVMGVPTVLFIKDGEVVDRFKGFRPEEQMNEIINQYI